MTDNRTKSLYPSLVGSSIEFSFQKKLSCATPITKNIQSAKKRIEHSIEMAFATGGELCVMLLAELTNFYRNVSYYMAVRSSIEMRRYRPAVLSYLQLDVQERADRLKFALSEKLRRDKNRDVKIEILRYFVDTYPHRIKEFKKLLTREEYTLVV